MQEFDKTLCCKQTITMRIHALLAISIQSHVTRFCTQFCIAEKLHVATNCTISLNTTDCLTYHSKKRERTLYLLVWWLLTASQLASYINGNVLWLGQLCTDHFIASHTQYNFVHFIQCYFEKFSYFRLFGHFMTRRHIINLNYIHITEWS